MASELKLATIATASVAENKPFFFMDGPFFENVFYFEEGNLVVCCASIMWFYTNVSGLVVNRGPQPLLGALMDMVM